MGSDSDHSIGTAGQRAAGWFLPGVRILVLGTVVVLGGIALIFVTMHQTGVVASIVGLLSALVLLAGILLVPGATQVSPGHPRVIQLFGRYCGTIHHTGLKWASSYPYDNRGMERLSLRDNAEEITAKLSAELTNRAAPAGRLPGHVQMRRPGRPPRAADADQA